MLVKLLLFLLVSVNAQRPDVFIGKPNRPEGSCVRPCLEGRDPYNPTDREFCMKKCKGSSIVIATQRKAPIVFGKNAEL